MAVAAAMGMMMGGKGEIEGVGEFDGVKEAEGEGVAVTVEEGGT